MTYSELLASEAVRKDYPALVEALASLGDAQVRNRATIGGSLAYNDPTADLPTVALVLEAVIKTVGPNGERARPAEEFLIGALKTTLESGEIVAAIHFPASVAGAWSAYEKFKCPATGAAICGVAAMVARGNGEGVCRVAVTGAAGHSARLHKVEAALTGLEADCREHRGRGGAGWPRGDRFRLRLPCLRGVPDPSNPGPCRAGAYPRRRARWVCPLGREHSCNATSRKAEVNRDI